MNCEAVRTFLDAYSTDELDLVGATQVEEHLAACPACAEELAELKSLRRTLKDPSLRFTAPAALRGRIEANREPAGHGSAWRVARIAAVALLFLVPWFAWYWSATRSDATQLADEITSSHVRSLMSDHLLDVPSTDQHTVKPWFAGKVDFSPVVVDLSGDGFPLVGGRLDYVQKRAVAAIVYQRNKHVINVFVWPTGDADAPTRSSMHAGYNLVTWMSGGLKYVAVSDVNAQELDRLVSLIRSARPTTRP
jgi:anti-sigma factor RsiW